MYPPTKSYDWPSVHQDDWCMQWAEDRERVVERIKEVVVEDAR
jgi:hypothetical protein